MEHHPEVRQAEVQELARAREAGAVVLDVRGHDEFERGHVPGARLLPLPELASRLDEVPRVAGVMYVVCASGGRSQRACEMLAAQGFSVANVVGGTKAWIEAGLPVATGSE